MKRAWSILVMALGAVLFASGCAYLMLQGMDRFDELLGSVANRIVTALIISAIVIGSSLLLAFSDKTFFGLPLGFFGYVLSTLFGLWIVLDIFRRGRLR